MLMNSAESERETTHNKKIIVVSTFLFVMAIIIISGLLYLQHRASQTYISSSESRKRRAEEMAAESRGPRLVKARRMREQWQTWAIKHKSELKRMLNATTKDQTALSVVWEKLPIGLEDGQAGMKAQEVIGEPNAFTWQPVAKGGHLSSNVSAEWSNRVAASNRAMQMQRQKNFVLLKDIEISRSMNPGTSQLSLWASGRITESKTVVNPNHRSGQPAFVELAPQEIEPPYDFLKQ